MVEPRFDNMTEDGPEKASRRPQICEESGGHRLTVKTWPPRARHPSSKRPPHIVGKCDRCGCHLIVYDPPQEGITVVKPAEPRLAGKGG